MLFSILLASIISKKAAAGIKYLILDLKVGSASFFQSIDKAKTFGKQFVSYSNNLKNNYLYINQIYFKLSLAIQIIDSSFIYERSY